MLHLSAERLAALAEAEPTALEAAHLEACHRCATERAAHHQLLVRAGAEAHRISAPLTRWETLAPALADEGLLVSGGRRRSARVSRLSRVWLRRAAAVVVLVGGGVAAGRLSAGVAPLPGLGAPAAASAAGRFASQDEALEALGRAERDYRAAAAFLAAQSRPADGLEPDGAALEAYQTRLAALDEVASVTRAALYDAPHDPVINQYYLASLGAREATLRQLGTSLPAGQQLNRF
ncbi:MAG TPA: hypothetical protein VFY16_10220 [Gemmatimonadaceae bacterium]|nr:hypothetical protein [Gemmatimonadaceae bacterium]